LGVTVEQSDSLGRFFDEGPTTNDMLSGGTLPASIPPIGEGGGSGYKDNPCNPSSTPSPPTKRDVATSTTITSEITL